MYVCSCAWGAHVHSLLTGPANIGHTLAHSVCALSFTSLQRTENTRTYDKMLL